MHHKHLIIRAEIQNSILCTQRLENWMKSLIKSIDMKSLYGPVCVYCNTTGNKGITGFSIIETSHIALHTWDETYPALLQLDVYTCSPLIVDTVISGLDIFGPITLQYKFLDRENELIDATQC